MLVLWDQRLVLLSVPNTGSTALEGALSPHAAIILRNPPTLKHAPVYRYRRFLEPLLVQGGGAESLETVALVRNPIAWLSSWYRYRSRDDLAGHRNSTRDISFDDFVLEYLNDKPAPFAAVGSQATFLQGKDGSLGVDHLYQYEAIDQAVTFFETRLGQTLTLNRRDVSPDFPVALSPAIEAQLKEQRPAEFAIWERGKR